MEGKKPNDSARVEEQLRLALAAHRTKKETGDFTEALRKLLTDENRRKP